MDKSDQLLEKCFKCKSYQENDCGIYFMMALWQKECKFFRKTMTKYQQFLEKISVISEEKFNEIVNEFPEVDVEELDFCYNDYDTVDDVTRAFIDVVLKEYDFVYTDEINFDTRTISFEDVDTLEDLELIKQRFSNWTITNYDELKEELIQEEKEDLKTKEHSERMNLVCKVIDKVPIEDLKEFCNKYE